MVSALVTALSSCGPSSHETDTAKHSTQVELNNGEKWDANPETIEGIENMQEIIANFEESNEKEYAELKSQLEREFRLIFERCTMTGESHNQLHAYLTPISKLLKDMDASKASETDELLQRLKAHLNSFSDYFR